MRNLTFLVTLLLLSVGVSGYLLKPQPRDTFTLVVHGGAGTITRENMTPEMETEIREKLTEAINAGYTLLDQGSSAVDAVEATINILEDSPLFNAGKGAVFTHELTNELDASIMDGYSLNAGAVSGVKTVKNPISAARKVMTDSKHVMLSGEGADLFAAEQGLEIVSPAYFRTQKRWEQIHARLGIPVPAEKTPEATPQRKGKRKKDRSELSPMDAKDWKFGTVGCVALDREGNIAAGTSTGGMTDKRFGRIGDSPVIGAGTYANNATCGVSCTGHGEYFIRYAVAHDLSAMMEYAGISLREAAERIIFGKLKEAGGDGGLIALDREGNVVMMFNTEGMYRGYRKAGEDVFVGVFGE